MKRQITGKKQGTIITARAVVFWIFLLLLLVIFVGGDLLIENQTKRILALCDEILTISKEDRWEEMDSAADKLDEEWQKDSVWWTLMFEHIETDNIELNLDQVIEHSRERRPEMISEYVTFVKSQMKHMQDIEGFSMKSLI